MGKMVSSNVQENEILKAVDVNNGFDAQISNITKALQCLLENKQDFVIGSNELVKYNSEKESDWTLRLDPIYGVCHSTGIGFLDTEVSTIAVQQPTNGYARRDIIEVCGVMETINPQKRSFIDFDTKSTVVDSVDTQKILALKCRCKSIETEGSIEIPQHTEGWVKIAELYIPGDATKISDCTIYNITSDVEGKGNENWELEKNITFNVGYLSSVNKNFRSEHNEFGQHNDNVIHVNNLDIGIEDNQINSELIPTGAEIKINDKVYGPDVSSTEMVKQLALFSNLLYNKLTSLTGDDVTVTDEEIEDTLNNTLKVLGKVKKVNEQSPDENGMVTVTGDNINVVFKGEDDTLNNTFDKINTIRDITQAKYDELTEEEKMNGLIYNIVDVDDDYVLPVDVIEDGNMNPVTSNAVYNTMPKIWSGTQEQYDAIEVKDNNTLYLIEE